MKHVVSARNQQCLERMSNDQLEKTLHTIIAYMILYVL